MLTSSSFYLTLSNSTFPKIVLTTLACFYSFLEKTHYIAHIKCMFFLDICVKNFNKNFP